MLGTTSAAREDDGSRIAAWFVESVVNLAGQQITFGYRKDEGVVYLESVKWAGGNYRLDLFYDGRTDVVTSYRTGFARRYALRLSRIEVATAFQGAHVLVRAYVLRYDDQETPDDHLPVSRLAKVEMFGDDFNNGTGTALPALTFQYAHAQAAAITTPAGVGAWVLNQRGVSFADVDGDGAEDLLRLEAGNHQFRRNLGTAFGEAVSITGASDIDLESSQLVDLDGDARPELVRIVDDTWRSYKLVDGKWASQGLWPGTTGVPLHDGSTVLCDVNGDGRIDVVRAKTTGISVYLGGPGGLAAPLSLPPISPQDVAVEPGKSNVRFVDVNGDGLVDVVWLTDSWMKIFLGRGDGTFVVYNRVFYPWGAGAFDDSQIILTDLNRDGLMDVVRLSAAHVYWYPGEVNGSLSDKVRQITRPADADVDAVVTIADGDANGSPDVDLVFAARALGLRSRRPYHSGNAHRDRQRPREEHARLVQVLCHALDRVGPRRAALVHELPVPLPVIVDLTVDPGAMGSRACGTSECAMGSGTAPSGASAVPGRHRDDGGCRRTARHLRIDSQSTRAWRRPGPAWPADVDWPTNGRGDFFSTMKTDRLALAASGLADAVPSLAGPSRARPKSPTPRACLRRRSSEGVLGVRFRGARHGDQAIRAHRRPGR